ncbi:SDR family oxidoreductase [Catenovulum sp. SM1970]|uniref:SDR family oxidoreductase n=1 Tax=Marinifaba aquimaris TaxID=2741323 RepID=UPI001572FBF5|nr:SDR family oxidoreductase [Marinifaba aquimaris]NTS75938.1 SDR family oxidoreductase [Marinifaba aquimaris]
MKNILIIGANSAMAQAVAKQYANRACSFFLVARDGEKLDTLAKDLTIRGAHSVTTAELDVTNFMAHAPIIEDVFDQFDQLDLALIAHGTLPDQTACQTDVELALKEIRINATSSIALMTDIANRMEQQKSGTIACITSVAGDRGRQSNYLYGSAKAMVSTFLQGLRNRLDKSGVKVIDIKPGFVDTPMTADFKKGALWATPEKVAKDISNAVDKGKSKTLYTPGFWALIMLIIRNIPEFIFKKLSL